MPRVEAVVLAAGASRRFGPANKLLQPFGGATVVGSVVQALFACGLPVRVVTGHEADLVAQAVAPAQTVLNPDWELGMGSSLACGAAACASDSAILVALGDMPGLRPEVVHALLTQLDIDAQTIVAPVYTAEPDRLGHPVLFGHGHRGALMALTGDEGARKVIAPCDRVICVPVQGNLIDRDEPL